MIDLSQFQAMARLSGVEVLYMHTHVGHVIAAYYDPGAGPFICYTPSNGITETNRSNLSSWKYTHGGIGRFVTMEQYEATIAIRAELARKEEERRRQAQWGSSW
jgi:hypothetical protein